MIRVCEPIIGETELKGVENCLRSRHLTSGVIVAEFERKWADYCGVDHGVAVSSGTMALELALRCLGLSPGSEVILPSFTIISCVLAVIRAGLVPVLVDTDAETWCLNAEAVRDAVTDRTAAIMPVHIYGQPADMDELLIIAEHRDLFVVEDAAQAHGAEVQRWTGGWSKCGSMGHLGCFSFYTNKIVTTGEGGMIVTNSAPLAENLRYKIAASRLVPSSVVCISSRRWLIINSMVNSR
jgi:perosamine synthetase